MLRPSLIAILQVRNAPFTLAEMDAMREGEAWEWVRLNCPVKARLTLGNEFEVTIPGVCFSGMDTDSRPMLRDYALMVGFRVTTKMSQVVDYLVVGGHPGPVKLAYAQESGIEVVPVAEFVTHADELYDRAMATWRVEVPEGAKGCCHGRIPKRYLR